MRNAYFVTLSVKVLVMGENPIDAQINAENAAQDGAYDARFHDEAEATRVVLAREDELDAGVD